MVPEDDPPASFTTRCPECGAEFGDPEPPDIGCVRDTVTCTSGHAWTVLDEGGAGNVREYLLGPPPDE
ncbi:MAG TPA: hypothetical protein VGF04_04250 [Solirubrobacterales bacterium]|jgi:hypothetical protein